MKKIFTLILILLIAFNVFPEGNEPADEGVEKIKDKENPDIKLKDLCFPEIYSKTSAEFQFSDSSNDSTYFDFTPMKNSPVFLEQFGAFIKLDIFKNKNIIFGPYVYSELEGKMDRREANNGGNTFVFEEFGALGEAGIKAGFEFGNYMFTGSSLVFSIPLHIKFDINDKDDVLALPDGSNQIEFYSNLNIGTNFGILLELKSKINYLSFIFENYLIATADLLYVDNAYGKTRLFIEEKNIMEFNIKPLNFINKMIDIQFAINNRAGFYYDSINFGIKERAYFEIEWDGFKHFGISYKPIIYNFSLKIPKANIYDAYDQFQSLSTEVEVFFGNKNIELSLSYEPTYWALDKTQINADEIRSHTLKGAVELKF